MSLFSTIANNINGFDVPLEFLHKGIFQRLIVKLSFKESNSGVVQILQIRIYAIERTNANASDELSIFDQNAIEQDKEQIYKYVENIHKIDNTNVVYLGILLQHNALHFKKFTEEQYNKQIEVLYDEVREIKQQPKQEPTQDQMIARRKELQNQLNEINTKYNKKYKTEMEKLDAQHQTNIYKENALYNQRRTDLRKQLEVAERNETKAITDELEQLKQKIKPTTSDLSSAYETLIRNFISMLSD